MKHLLFLLLLVSPLCAFVVPMEFDAKCQRADLIVHGAVIDIIPLTQKVNEDDEITPVRDDTADYEGPHTLALIRRRHMYSTALANLI